MTWRWQRRSWRKRSAITPCSKKDRIRRRSDWQSARVANAQTQLAAAQAAVGRLKLTAPFSGTVSEINSHSGEWVTAGQTVLTLADLEQLRVETTDLSERDIPLIQIGQTATVFIEALGET